MDGELAQNACDEVSREPGAAGTRFSGDDARTTYRDHARASDRLTAAMEVVATGMAKVAILAADVAQRSVPLANTRASRLDQGNHRRLSLPIGTHAPRVGALAHGRPR